MEHPDSCYMNVGFLGGAMEVGASCILIRIADYSILLDCGIRQTGGKDPLPDLRKIQECGGLDAIIISHAHMDHIGSLPVISREYPNAPIYMTSMSADLTRVLLYDSLKLMDRQEDGIPMYAQKHVLDTLARIHPIRFNEPGEILPDLSMTMYPAGHIAGAACIYLTSPAGSLFYSGDFSSFSQNTIEGAMVPKLRPDVAILESTYGDRLHSNRQVEEGALLKLVAECAEKKGKMLIPAFALGRSQEVILILRRGMASGAIPQIPVYVDGMVRDICTVYSRYPTFLKRSLARQAERGRPLFYNETIQPVLPTSKRDELIAQDGPVIIVSSSGMLTGGPSIIYASMIAPREDGYIVITGYQDEEAPGRKLQELLDAPPSEERTLSLGALTVPVRCKVAKIGISAHGDKSEIQALAERLSPRFLFLVHGDPAVIPGLAADMGLDYRTRIYTPMDGDFEEIQLKNPRQQLKRKFLYTMQRQEELNDPENPEKSVLLQKLFASYLKEHYPDGRFTIQELSYIWYGTVRSSDEEVESFRAQVNASPYISNDIRRMFLYRPATEDEIKEALTFHGPNQDDLKAAAMEIFGRIPVRKVSFYIDRSEANLQVDFPLPWRDEFESQKGEFLKRTGFRISMNETPNEHAMDEYLKAQFGSSLLKVSMRKQEEKIVLRLKGDVTEEQLSSVAEEFESLTGYQLLTQEAPGSQDVFIAPLDEFLPPEGGEKMEQNKVLTLVGNAFRGRKNPPQKKGVGNDHFGCYIRLSFMTPAIGRQSSELIQKLASETGWRIRIADSVNQNEIFRMALEECEKRNVELMKNPSYQPGTGSLVLRPVIGTDPDRLAEVIWALTDKTGLKVTSV